MKHDGIAENSYISFLQYYCVASCNYAQTCKKHERIYFIFWFLGGFTVICNIIQTSSSYFIGKENATKSQVVRFYG